MIELLTTIYMVGFFITMITAFAMLYIDKDSKAGSCAIWSIVIAIAWPITIVGLVIDLIQGFRQ